MGRSTNGNGYLPTVHEIAVRAGVSKSTVSLTLNNRPHVSERTRKRIMDVVDELRGSAPRAGRGIAAPRLLLLHPDQIGSLQVFRELMQGINTGVEETKSRITLAVHRPPLREDHAASLLLHDASMKPDGVLIMGATLDDPILSDVQREGLPCVLVARESAPPGFSSVGMDNAGGMRAAVEHLLELGHKTLAFLGGNPAYEWVLRRRESFLAASQDVERTVYLGGGKEAAAAFLAAEDPATAIAFVNDEHALEALPALEARGWKIGEDRAAVSFDDTSEIARHDPPLSSISVPRFEIGRWAVRVLVDHLRHPDLKCACIVLRTRLRAR